MGADAVRRLVGDSDPLVRAAALAALGAVGCGDDDLAHVQRALTEPAWQVREGAARALAGAVPTVAVPALSRALTDQHLDVRKAAVLTLTRWAADEPAAREALDLALEDGDADVRAYARHALAGQLSSLTMAAWPGPRQNRVGPYSPRPPRVSARW